MLVLMRLVKFLETSEVMHGALCCLQDNSPISWWFSFSELYLAKDWAQIRLEVLAVKINIFRDFTQLNELQCLEPAFKRWPLFKVILFRKDTLNVHEP